MRPLPATAPAADAGGSAGSASVSSLPNMSSSPSDTRRTGRPHALCTCAHRTDKPAACTSQFCPPATPQAMSVFRSLLDAYRSEPNHAGSCLLAVLEHAFFGCAG